MSETDTADIQALRMQRAAKALQTRADRLLAAAKDDTFPLGAEVQVRNNARAAYYTGQRGVVREHHMGEVGVRFNESDSTDAFFLRSELLKI